MSLNPNQNGEPRRFLSFGKDNEETIPALSGDSDQKWQDEFDSKLVGALSVQMKYENPADESETAYCRSCICDAQKVLTSLLNQAPSFYLLTAHSEHVNPQSMAHILSTLARMSATPSLHLACV